MGEKYQYRSPHTREIVYDPEDPKAILAEFLEHKFETDDKALAHKLEKMGYEPWAEITEDDVFILADGSEVRVADLDPKIAQTILGAPKKLIKKGISKLSGGEDNPDANPSEFVCPIEECGRTFKSQAALNGHMASHAKDKTD